jgi:hypothetical protein
MLVTKMIIFYVIDEVINNLNKHFSYLIFLLKYSFLIFDVGSSNSVTLLNPGRF